jgi:hypothetical protein
MANPPATQFPLLNGHGLQYLFRHDTDWGICPTTRPRPFIITRRKSNPKERFAYCMCRRFLQRTPKMGNALYHCMNQPVFGSRVSMPKRSTAYVCIISGDFLWWSRSNGPRPCDDLKGSLGRQKVLRKVFQIARRF